MRNQRRQKGVLENDIETALEEFSFEDQLQNSIKKAPLVKTLGLYLP